MDNHNAIILGKKMRYVWHCYSYTADIYQGKEEIEKVELFNGVIENPPLEVDDFVFIPELKKSVKVTGKSRNIEGGYVYYTDYVTEVVDDEQTQKSKKEAEEQLEVVKVKVAESAQREKEKEYNKLNWFKKLFTAKP